MKETLKNYVMRFRTDHRGSMLALVIVFGSVATLIIVSGVSSYAISENRASNRKQDRDLAFHIAEAGANYYRWHLAHDPNDYQDGTGGAGPYEHDYLDKDGNVVGMFSLEIDPPLVGSTVVTVRSTGVALAHPETTRTVQIKLGFPSLTDYAFVDNTDMIFSNTTEVHGKVHSNSGIEFRGTTDAAVESAQETYWASHVGEWKPGVWGVGGPTQFFNFPVPQKDFNAVSADLAAIRDLSDNGGEHLNSSGKSGWHIVFLGNGTYSLYKVKSTKYQGWTSASGYKYYDINSETYHSNKAIPSNGVIFVEDHVWVEGTIDRRVTIGAGRFPVQPSTYRDIIIPNNLVYAEKSSDDVLGLIAQGDIIVPYNVPNDMEIDAAALAQFGQISRPWYGYYTTRNSILFFGSQISYLGGGWKWGSPVVSGFVNTNHTYDGNLKYFPPAGFPVSGDFELISWEEIE